MAFYSKHNTIIIAFYYEIKMYNSTDNGLELRRAAAAGDLEKVKELIQIDRNLINSQGPSTGKTALHQAFIAQKKNIAEYLLSFDNLINIKDKDGKTAYDYLKIKTTKELRQALPFLRLLDRPGFGIPMRFPPSDYIHRNTNVIAFKNRLQSASKVDVLRLDIGTQNTYLGFPYLGLVVLHNNELNGVRELITDKGYDPNQTYADFNPLSFRGTVLHTILANEDSDAKIIKFLTIVKECQKKIDFKYQDIEGKTPLLLAVKTRRSSMVKILLEFGAIESIPICDAEGKNIFHIAYALGDSATVNLIKNYINDNEMHSLMETKDISGRTPLDMLDLSESQTRHLLESIWINPDRDANAPLNNSKAGSFELAGYTFLEVCLNGRKEMTYTIETNTFTC